MSDTAPLVGSDAKQEPGARHACVVVTFVAVPVLLIAGYFAGVQVLYQEIASDQKGMVRLNPDFVHEFCNHKGDNISYEEKYAHLVEKAWWPGCGFDKNPTESDCGEPCYSASFMKEMLDFNVANPGKLVSYKSRQEEGTETVTLRGWWLPPVPTTSDGDDSNKSDRRLKAEDAPRIVLQHGTTSNSNKYRQVAAAYLLRKLGFGVLVNNLRDHCYSDDSEQPNYVHWGHSYPLDLLGAWDYAVKDPEHELGGALDKSKVGLFGFSMGAFTTSTAFGMAGEVPAAWADGGPFSPKTVTFATVKNMAGPMAWAVPLIEDHVWSKVQAEAEDGGVDMAKTNPQKTLPMGPDTARPYFIVHNKNDGTSAFSEHIRLKNLLQDKDNAKKYDYDTWTTEGSCHGTAHCADHVIEYDTYLQKACNFWYPVFELDKKKCSKLSPKASVKTV